MEKRVLAPATNGRVRLRLLCETDLPLTLAWRNQDHIRCWFFNSGIIQPEQHAAWFQQYRDRDDDFVFVIEEAAAGCQPVGQVSLYHIDWESCSAEYGRLLIGEASACGKGLARAATELVLQIGFDVLGLNDIYLEVLTHNHAARRVYEACGFTQVGEHQNIVRMAISRPARKIE
jgi:RimJ/RimL family protein N-acetyltransferase